MTTDGCCPKLPRPWYISLTAVWDDDPENNNELDSHVSKRAVPFQPAGHHLVMPKQCRHFSVLAILKINGHPAETRNMRKFAGRVFEPIRNNNGLLNDLRGRFEPFTAKVDGVHCFDSGTTLQFECGRELEVFRKHARCVLDEPVADLVKQYNECIAGRGFKKEWGVKLVQSILADPDKNYGTRAFGSIARSPCRCDRSIERWREEIRDGVSLKFQRIHLLVSDEMLTNPRNRDEDVPIRPERRGRRRTRRP